MLRERHRSRIEPAVDYFRHTVHLFAAFRTGDRDLVNVRTVKLHGLRPLVSAHLAELLTASDRMHMATVRALPDIQRRTPVTVSGNTPILYILQPVSETAFADALRDPVDGIIVADQILFHRCHLDKPGLSRVVDQRSIASPAVRIFVLKLGSVEQLSFFVQILKDHGIRFFHKYARIRRLVSHISGAVHELYKRKAVLLSYTVVVFTESRSRMNDTGTVAHGYISVADYIVAFFLLSDHLFTGTRKQRLIFFIFQILSFICLQNLISRRILRAQFSKHRVQKSLCHIISIAIRGLYLTIRLIRIHAQRHIGRQRPGRCGPRQEICVFSLHFEAHDSGALLYSLIALGNLLGRQRCAAAGAVRNDFKPFIKEPSVPDRL